MPLILQTASINQEKLFIIIGMGRSGTSLLQEIMNTFDGFCNMEESRIDSRGSMGCYAFLQKNDYSYLERFIQENWTREYFVEKSPNSIRFLPQLHQRFPDANYIFLERHPLKILLSQLNKWSEEIAEERMERRYKMGLSEQKGTIENYQVFRAKKILQQVKRQRMDKHRFAKQITIRFEDLIADVESQVIAIAQKFKIKMDVERARKIISRPSYSSKRNTYSIKALSDPKAIEIIRKACELWNYRYEDAI